MIASHNGLIFYLNFFYVDPTKVYCFEIAGSFLLQVCIFSILYKMLIKISKQLKIANKWKQVSTSVVIIGTLSNIAFCWWTYNRIQQKQ